MAKTATKDLERALQQIQQQLEALSARVEQMEAGIPKPEAADSSPVQVLVQGPAPEPAKPEITEEEMIAISAALGAYLGVRIRLKQIRLLSSRVWAQQGRVSIQASHNLHN